MPKKVSWLLIYGAIMDSILILGDPGDPITELQPTCDHTWVLHNHTGVNNDEGVYATTKQWCFCKKKLSWNSSNASCDVISATILGRFTSIWLVVWNICYFSIYWECHHPNWLTFFRGIETTNQPQIELNHGLMRTSYSERGSERHTSGPGGWILVKGRLIWVNYNDLTATSLESWLVREMIPKWP